MVNTQVIAHSVATVVGATFILCRLLVAVAPNLLYTIGNSWFHTLTLDPARASGSMTLGAFVLGLLSSVIVSWLFTCAVAELYNRWAK